MHQDTDSDSKTTSTCHTIDRKLHEEQQMESESYKNYIRNHIFPALSSPFIGRGVVENTSSSLIQIS